MSIADSFLALECALCEFLNSVDFIQDPITHLYNPIDYAWNPHQKYVHKFGNTKKKILFLGMNPGPYGMAQTGVPFGSVSMVRHFLNICGEVDQPAVVHPKRPITGFNCPREEVSGTRFWTLVRELCTTPENFFHNCFVYNHCPLVFMSKSGKNVNAEQVPKSVKQDLYKHCDQTLIKVIQLYEFQHIVCIGKYAEKRCKVALKNTNLSVSVDTILHPSPMTHQTSDNWMKIVKGQLEESGLLDIIICNS